MSLTDHEKKVIDQLVDEFGAAAVKIWANVQDKNAGFALAADRQYQALKIASEERWQKAFRALLWQKEDRSDLIRDYFTGAVERLMRETALNTSVSAIISQNPSDGMLRNYLQVMTALLEGARKQDGAMRSLDGDPVEEGVRFASVMWAAMRNARVFDFSLEDFARLYHATDVYATEKIAGFKFTFEPQDVPSEESKLYVEKLGEAGARVPFPEQLPFDFTYIGFGHGIPLTQEQIWCRVGSHKIGDVIGSALLGYMIWGANGGMVVEVIQIVENDDNFILPHVVCSHGTWRDPHWNLAPWMITQLIGLINEHRQIVLEPVRASSQMKRDFEKARKRLRVQGMVPRPYYIVRMEKKLIDDSGKRIRNELAKIARELSYRHDRRGHERCYIRRGQLPLAEKDRVKMEKVGYKIWTINEPDSNAYRQLMDRGQPPKATTEWIAILTKWIDEQVVGSEDLPYIPAIRVPAASPAASPARAPGAMPGVPREA